MRLFRCLPRLVVVEMMGGERGLQQVADPARREAQLRRKFLARAGSGGSQIGDLHLSCGKARAYAREVMRATPGAEDGVLWPMSESLADEIVRGRAHASEPPQAAGRRERVTQSGSQRSAREFRSP